MGRLARAMHGFGHPAAFRPDFPWSLDHVAALRGHTADIADPARRALVERLFDRYATQVAPRLPALRAQVLHQDANDWNVITDATGPDRIAGLIDFGDMCHGRLVNELAITLAYAALATDPATALRAVTRGFATAMPLTEDEAALAYDLMRMRLVMSVCISSRQAKLHPGNDYLLISQAPAFALLERLDAEDPARMIDICLDAAGFLRPTADPAAILSARRARIGPSLSLSYRDKLTILRGQGCWLFDHQGQRYLDTVNNITHVGHCHPHVVQAISRQAALLNTNTRYLHPLMPALAERITATLPGDLSVVYFVNSGTEANELALRIARTALGKKDTVVLDWAYHGNSGGTVEISPYKFKRKGGFPQPDFVQVATFPDPYRGPHRGADSGPAYAADLDRCLDAITARTGDGAATFIAESVSGVGGQVVLPGGYLSGVYDRVRARGGICIADEVQCGFGRVGTAFWGFQLQGVTPDIVVLGKPIGNGHPLGAVVTTPELAAKFANGMEYFNSFGGNPVSMAAGHAVLDVIQGEGLQDHARRTGDYLMAGYRRLAERHEVIGDVRGSGLFIGVELVKDRDSRAPDAAAAGQVVEHLRRHGILSSTDGPDDNVLKIKPPMVFGPAEADLLLAETAVALDGLTR
jgi:4-aminobutyrate aminotransferase-like enzyme